MSGKTGKSGGKLVLAIEVSNPSAGGGGGVAIGRMGDGRVEVLGVRGLMEAGGAQGQAAHDDVLIPLIDALFTSLGLDPRDLGLVGVSVGPGGYTGLRVACITGKMIAEGAGCGCAAVRSAAVVAAAREGGPVAVALASKRDSAWVEVYERPGDLSASWSGLVSAAGLGAVRAGPASANVLIADRFLPVSLRSEAERMGLLIEVPRFDPEVCLRLAAASARVEPGGLNPVYPREPDAVTLWRARGDGGKK